jgi:HPt (histidine-containing phosphotransfer) domain-containing protein
LTPDNETVQDIFTRHKMFGGQLSGVIDIEALRTISQGNPDFVREMVGIFGVQIRLELSKLKEAIKTQNSEQTAQIAHSIKSTVGYVGIREALINDLNYLESFQEDPEVVNFVRAEGSYQNISAICLKAIDELKMLGFEVSES